MAYINTWKASRFLINRSSAFYQPEGVPVYQYFKPMNKEQQKEFNNLRIEFEDDLNENMQIN